MSAAAALLSVFLCLPQGTLVLCASESGHLAIEAACGSGAEAHEQAPPAPGMTDHCECDDGCGPCRDSQVGTELSAGRVREHRAESSTFAALPMAAPLAATFALPPAPARTVLRAPDAAPPALARVRSGVQLRL